MTSTVTEHEVIKRSEDSREDIILSVQGVSKKFCRDLKRSLFYGIQDIAGEITALSKQRDTLRHQEFWALRDASFELRRGEALGLVGKNGSGKSTLLRIIAGLIRPDIGSVEVKGKVAPLIALGAGFNPILTGRENIYANMSILGLSEQEIDERFDAVVDFAEVGDAIDAPVRSYSSGMAARLGFASAVYTEPDILLIDEVLAVGDIKFRNKCYRKLRELLEKKTSFVLVSHQSYAVLTACNSAVYLSKGECVDSGDTYSIMNRYERELFEIAESKELGKIDFPQKSPEQSFGFDIISIFFRDSQEKRVKTPKSGEDISLCIKYKAYNYRGFNKVYVSFTISRIGGEREHILRLSSFDDKKPIYLFAPENNCDTDESELQIQMPKLGLIPGLYTLKLLVKKDSLYTLDCVESFEFKVDTEINMSQCKYYQPRNWTKADEMTDGQCKVKPT